MNRYIFIHRLTGPAVLLLLGTVWLLHQAHIVGFWIFVPLLLILIGVLQLAERAALAADPSFAESYGPANPPAAPNAPKPVGSFVTPQDDGGKDPNGGQL